MAQAKFERRRLVVLQSAIGVPLTKMYNDWALQYDGDMEIVTDTSDQIFDEVDKFFHNNNHALILDVGAGTGYAGKELKRRGYTNLEAVEPSEKMIAIAQENGLYRKTHSQFIGPTPLPVPANTYDCVVTVKTIAARHLGASAVEDLCRVLKPGGYFMMEGNYDIWSELPEFHVEMADKMQQMADEMRWKLVKRSIIDKYVVVANGVENRGLFLVYMKL